MVNFVEALFGFAALCFLAAFVLAFRGRRSLARRYALIGGGAAVIAIVLELYLRWSA